MTRAESPGDRVHLAQMGSRYQLWASEEEPTIVSHGAENTTYAVGDYIVRRSDDLEAVSREVELLNALARATSVPTPTPALHEPALGAFAYRRLAGTPLLHRPQRDIRAIELALIDVLLALRRIVPASRLPTDRYPNEEWHNDAVQMFRFVRTHLNAEQESLVQAFLDEPPPPDRAVVLAQHNDLGVEHILVDDQGEVTGIIDWTDAALTDPARDIGSIYRDLGPNAAVCVGEALNGPLTEDEARRIRFHARCRWLEDVGFGIRDPLARKPYLDNAWRTLGHTFRKTE